MRKGKVKVVFRGVTYMIENTLGPYREFKKLTGKEVDQATGLSEMAELLYCFVKVAARRAGTEFNVTVEEFLDEATQDQMQALTDMMVTAVDVDSTSSTKKK